MTLAGMTAEETKQYNTEHCRRIAERLEAVASGQVWRCEECGEEFDELEGGDEWDGETCPHCGAADCFEQVGMYDWLDDALDYTFTMDSKGRMLGARVMVA